MSQDRESLCIALYHARRQLSAVDPADINGRCDVLHRIRHIEEALGSIDEEAFASFVLRMEEAAAERARLARERAYERTGGLIAHD
jgi:hypothetical protein